MLERWRTLLLPMVLWSHAAWGAASDAAALYGEAAVLRDYSQPQLRSGHDALRPLTDALVGYFDFKERLSRDHGFDYTIEYSPQFQWDLDGGHTSNSETNFIAQWSLVDSSSPKRGSLLAWYQISRTLSDLTTSEFMDQAGIISPVNGGDTAPTNYRDLLQMLAWEQWFFDDQLRAGIGKLTTRTFLNLNRYAISDREDFFTPMVVNNPVVPFTARNGLGLFGQYHMDSAYLTGMLREADGTTTGIDFSTLESGNWEYALELGLTPENLAGLGQGYYRITGYYTDDFVQGAARSPSGWALSLSFDQDIGENYGALFRYAYASEPFRDFKQRAAAGLQIKNPLRYQYDRLGVAAWWGDPTDPGVGDEYGMEIFWKLQLAPYLELTPDLQVIFNPQGDQDRDSVFIAGLRLRLLF